METPFWPALPFDHWHETLDTLHLYTQIPGKIKLTLSPTLNEWWHAAYHFWARGITTGPMPYRSKLLEIRFDFFSHSIDILDSTGTAKSIELVPRTVAEFYRLFLSKLDLMGIPITLMTAPQEMPEDSIPLDQDTVHRTYDRDAVERFWVVLSQVSAVFEQFRSGFFGKASPVHFWWGSFDLNLTRFPGRSCNPPPKAGRLARIDCDEEHFSAGFWPGDKRLPQPAFYAYAYPSPHGLESAAIRPAQAEWNPMMGEFILRYDDVRNARNPEQCIIEFLTSTYNAAADLGRWDRKFLERKIE